VIEGGEPLYDVLIDGGQGDLFPADFDRQENGKYIYIPKKEMCAGAQYKVKVKDHNGN